MNNIHEALADVTCHSDQIEILAEVAFSSPPSESYYREEYAWRTANAALVIIALAAMLLRSSILTVHLCQGLV